MPLSFGVTVLPDPPYQRLVELMVLAESHGFEYGWTYDSHVLWQDSFPVLALAAGVMLGGALQAAIQIPALRAIGCMPRFALGFASLPTGVAVEVEAIFEIKG